MDFQTAVKTVLVDKYATFSGRALRSEYWWYALALMVAGVILNIVDHAVFGFEILGFILGIATIIPSLSVGVRRLHDRDKSGWWLLICVVPLVGFFILLYFLATRGSAGDNRFGPPPAV